MSINLTKGGRVSLAKEAPKLKNVIVGLGWDPAVTIEEQVITKKKGLFGKLLGGSQETEVRRVQRSGANIDCDAFAILVSGHGQDITKDTVWFSNLRHESGAVIHSGDNLTGDGDGDDEQIRVFLESLPERYQEVIVGVNIFAAESRRQTFGQIDNAFIRLVNADTNEEICKYNLSKDGEYNKAIAMVMGKLIRTHSGWDFIAMGNASMAKSIPEIAREYIK